MKPGCHILISIFKNRISNEGKPVSNPYLFFAMSSPYFAPREIDIVEKIATWVEENTWPGLNFIVRPHPQNVIGYLADLNWLPRLKNVERQSGNSELSRSQ